MSSSSDISRTDRRRRPASQQQQTTQAQTQLHLHIQPDARPSTWNEIERLLSSSLYPGASPDYSRHQQTSSSSVSPDDHTALYYQQDLNAGHVQNSDACIENDKKTSHNSKPPAASGKAAGTKRKANARENEEPGERRRKQIREAQRAYRQRKLSQTAYLEERVRQLESAIENMSSVVLCFSEELIGSNILSCQSELTSRLRDALATCLALVREAGTSADTADGPAAEQTTAPAPAPLALVPSIRPPLHPRPPGIRHILSQKPYPETDTGMTVASFMDMLATSVVYYGYLALADPTLSATRLHRHFGLPLQLMDRVRLLAFLGELYRARLSGDRPGGGTGPGMPFFSIGGAGTHYSPVLSTAAAAAAVVPTSAAAPTAAPFSLPWANAADQCATRSVRNNAWTVPMDKSSVPAGMQDRFEGDWFDLQDLELFLMEKGVSLRMHPTHEADGDVNVPLFIRALMLNSTCLGQSPGFRRRDVEQALYNAQRGPQVY